LNQIQYQQIKGQIFQPKREYHFFCESSKENNSCCSSCSNAIQKEWTIVGEYRFVEHENQRTGKPIFKDDNILCIPIPCVYAINGLAIIKLPLLDSPIMVQLKLF